MPRPLRPPPTPQGSSRSGLNILLVEDDARAASAIRDWLTLSGHAVATAATCAQALVHPALGRVQVLICDLDLPDGSGWDLLPKVRAANGPLYAVAITGSRQPDDAARSLAAGFGVHLLKPLAPQRLIELLGEVDWR
jgi:CheY-like chemotaxis protein